MPFYRLEPLGEPDADAYWIVAPSEMEARQVVALNVPDAALATDPARFGCFEDPSRRPPPTMIYRRLSGPVTITRR
jgi:hypothetical protein